MRVKVQLREKLLTEFKKREIRADSLLSLELLIATEAATSEGEAIRLLLHLEFQSTNDPTIGERVLDYQFEARKTHRLPVISVVIYLRDVGEVPDPSVRWEAPLPGLPLLLLFNYLSIELN